MSQDKHRLEEKPTAFVLQVTVKEEKTEEFIQVMTANTVSSREEEGCVRYDLMRDSQDPNTSRRAAVGSAERSCVR